MAENRLTDQQILNIAITVGWKGDDQRIAVAVALAESGGNSLAVHRNANGSTDYGLWQVNSVHGFDTDQLLEAVGNGFAAHHVWEAQGWNAWTTYKTGAYLLYMPRARTVKPSINDDGTVSGKSDTKTVNILSGFLDFFISGAQWLSKAHNWLRIAYALVGGGMVLAGLVIVSKPALQTAKGIA